MRKISRNVSFILSIVLLFNVLIPSFSNIVLGEITYEYSYNGVDYNGSGTYFFHLQRSAGSGIYNSCRFQFNPMPDVVIDFFVEETGLYTISATCKEDDYGYTLTKNSASNNLAVATYVNSDGQPCPISAYCNYAQRKVSVYLEAGTTYNIRNEKYGKSQIAYTVKRIDVEEASIVEIKDLDSKEYTGRNSGSISTQLPEDRLVTKEQVDTSTFGGTADEGKANLIQQAIVYLIIGVGDAVKALISTFVGNVSIDSLVFNQNSATKLSFYPENSAGDSNEYLSPGTPILQMINSYFNLFRGIAYVFYVIILLFVGIRVLVASTGRDKEKYKSLMSDWLVGILILTFFPIVIKYTILLNEGLVEIIETNVKSQLMSGGVDPMPQIPEVDTAMLEVMGVESDDSDIMSLYRKRSLDSFSLGYAFVYLFLIKELIGFILVYYKRMITIVFLIVLFPFVAISYVFDKVKDSKAQIFGRWVKEFLLNVFIQFFHSILYCAVTFLVIALMEGAGTADSVNIILVMVGLGYIRKGDTLLKALFPSILKGGGADTVKGIGSTASNFVKISTVSSIINSGKSIGNKAKQVKTKTANLRDKAYEHRANQNIANENKRAARIEGAKKADAKNPTKLQLNFEKATMGINTLPPAELEEMTEEQKVRRDLEIRREGLNAFAYAQNSNDPAVKAALEKFLSSKTPQERQKLAKQVEYNESINMLVTGKGRDGVELTEEQLNIAANVVVKNLQAGTSDPVVGSINKWMDTKAIKTGKKETIYSIGKNRTIVSKAKAEELRSKGVKVLEITRDKEVKLSEYFGFRKTADGRIIMGDGIKGRVLTEGGKTQKEKLREAFNKDAVIEEDSEKKATGFAMSSKERKALLESDDSKKKIDAMVTKFGAGMDDAQKAEVEEMAQLTIELGHYKELEDSREDGQKVSATETLRITSRMKELSDSNEGAKAILGRLIKTGTKAPRESAEGVDVSTRPMVGKPGGDTRASSTMPRADVVSGASKVAPRPDEIARMGTTPLSGARVEQPRVAPVHIPGKARDVLETKSRPDSARVEPTSETTRVKPEAESPKVSPRIDPSKIESRVETPRVTHKLDSTKYEPKIETTRVEPRIDTPRVEPRVDTSRTTPEAEVPRVTPRLDPSRIESRPVAPIEETTGEPIVETIEEVVEVSTDLGELEECVVDLGFSIDAYRAEAAKQVIKQHDVLTRGDRRKYTKMAVDAIRDSVESDDEVARNIAYTADMDDILEGYREVDDDGFLDEQVGTQEEIKLQRYEDRVRQTQEWYADGTLRRSRGAFARATGEAIGSATALTAGTLTEATAGTVMASFTSGVQKDPSINSVLISADAGIKTAKKGERLLMGSAVSEPKSKRGRRSIGTYSGDTLEKGMNLHRKKSENVDSPKYREYGEVRQAQNVNRAFEDAIRDYKKK